LKNKTSDAVNRRAVHTKSTAAAGKMLERVLIVTCLSGILSASDVYGPYSNVYVYDYPDDRIAVLQSGVSDIADAHAAVGRWMCINDKAYRIQSVWTETQGTWYYWKTSPAFSGGTGGFDVSFRSDSHCGTGCPVVDVSGVFYNSANGEWNLIGADVYQKGSWYLWKSEYWGYDCWVMGNKIENPISLSSTNLWGFRWGGNLFDSCDTPWGCQPWWIAYYTTWFKSPGTTVTCSSTNGAANDGNAVDGTDDLPEGLDLSSLPLPPRGGSDQSDTTHSGSGDYGVMIASAGAAAAFILMVTIVVNVVWRRKKRVSRDSTLKTDVAEHVTEMTPSNLDQEVMTQRMSSNGEAPDAAMEEKSAEKGIGIGVQGAVHVLEASAVSMEIANTAAVSESL